MNAGLSVSSIGRSGPAYLPSPLAHQLFLLDYRLAHDHRVYCMSHRPAKLMRTATFQWPPADSTAVNFNKHDARAVFGERARPPERLLHTSGLIAAVSNLHLASAMTFDDASAYST